MKEANARQRYVFIAGLHRTGTSLLAQMLGAHPDVATISGSPAPEDEGCYLQGAIPHTAMHGRPGHYATDPAQHHIEGSRFDRLETRERLAADWDCWFDQGGTWRLEKSPVNLTRMRLYQQLFPLSQFIVIVRHPEVMAAALRKWSDQTPAELASYGLDAYDVVADDVPYLHAVCVIRYEDLVRAPETVRAGLFAFLDLADHTGGLHVRDGNADYACDRPVPQDLAARLAKWGYAPGGRVEPFTPIVRHPLRAIREGTERMLLASQPAKLEKRKKEQKANIRQ